MVNFREETNKDFINMAMENPADSMRDHLIGLTLIEAIINGDKTTRRTIYESIPRNDLINGLSILSLVLLDMSATAKDISKVELLELLRSTALASKTLNND